MKDYQEKIIELYFQRFPNDSIRKISQKTKIQQTRVFRLLNGAEMRISEYFTFKNLLFNPKEESSFLKLASKCFSSLNREQIKDLQIQMKYKLKINTFNFENTRSTLLAN